MTTNNNVASNNVKKYANSIVMDDNMVSPARPTSDMNTYVKEGRKIGGDAFNSAVKIANSKGLVMSFLRFRCLGSVESVHGYTEEGTNIRKAVVTISVEPHDNKTSKVQREDDKDDVKSSLLTRVKLFVPEVLGEQLKERGELVYVEGGLQEKAKKTHQYTNKEGVLTTPKNEYHADLVFAGYDTLGTVDKFSCQYNPVLPAVGAPRVFVSKESQTNAKSQIIVPFLVVGLPITAVIKHVGTGPITNKKTGEIKDVATHIIQVGDVSLPTTHFVAGDTLPRTALLAPRMTRFTTEGQKEGLSIKLNVVK